MSVKHLNSNFVSLIFLSALLDALIGSSYNLSQDFTSNTWSTVPKNSNLTSATLALEVEEN